jgi:hypothetical protein
MPPRRIKGNRVGSRPPSINQQPELYPPVRPDERRPRPNQVDPRVYQQAQPVQPQQRPQGNQVVRPQQQQPVSTASELPGVYTSPELEQQMLNRRRPPSPVDLPPIPPSGNGGGNTGGNTVGNPNAMRFGDPIQLRTQREFTPDPDAVQLRLDLGQANAPMTMEALRQKRARIASERGGDPIVGYVRTADGQDVVYNIYDPKPQQAEWVATPSGPALVDRNKLGTLYKANVQSRTGLMPEEAIPVEPTRTGILSNIGAGLKAGFNTMTGIEPGDNTHFSHSVFQLLNPTFRQRYNDALDNNRLNAVGKAAAAVGALGGDMAKFGTISRLLWRSNAMDLMDTYGVPMAATAAGADPQNRADFKRYAIPMAIGAGLVTHVASGNLDPTKILNTEEGPRVDGYRAEYSSYDNPTKTENYALALYNQALPGGGARLLPWEQFHQERPDVSYEQYRNYQDYLWGERGFQLLGGGIKATNESIDAPEDAWAIDPRNYELRAGGYRITPIGAAAGLGALGLSALALKSYLSRKRMGELMARGLTAQQAQTAIAHQSKPVYKVPENIELL